MSSEVKATATGDATQAPTFRQAASKGPLGRRLIKVAAKLGLFWAAILVGLTLLVLAVIWGVGKTALLKYAVAEVVNLSDGRLKVEGLEGSLFGSIRIATLEALPKGLKVPGPKIVLNDVAIDWSLLSLLKTDPYREPVVYSLVAKSLKVSLPYSDQALKLPSSFALPLGLKLELVQLGLLQIEIARLDPSAAPQRIELRDLAARAKYSPKRGSAGTGKFELDRITLGNGLFRVAESTLSLEDQTPFKVVANGQARTLWLDELFSKVKFQADPKIRGDGSARFDFDILGELLDLQIRANIDTYKTKLQGELNFKFGQDRPVPSILLKSSSLDLQHIDVRAPKTDLNIQWRFEPRLGIPGLINFVNRTPGSFDARMLPFSKGMLKWSLDLPKLLLQEVEGQVYADAGQSETAPSKTIKGKGFIDFSQRQEFGTLSLPDSDLDLVASDLDLSKIISGLMPTQLSGPVRIKSGLFKVDLKQEPKTRGPAYLSDLGALSLQGDIRLVDNQLRYDGMQVKVHNASLKATGVLKLDENLTLETNGRAQGFKPSEFFAFDLKNTELNAAVKSAVFTGPFEVRGNLGSFRTNEAPERVTRINSDFYLSLNFEEGSQVLSRPLTGFSKMLLAKQRVSNIDASLISQGNRLKAQGALGEMGDRLLLELEAENLGTLDKRLKGRLKVVGELRDRIASPAIQASVQGQALSASGLGSAGIVKGDINLPSLAEGKLLVKLEASKVKIADVELDHIQLDAEGKASDHLFTVAGQGSGEKVQASGKGRYFPQAEQGQRYAAELQQTSLSGRFNAVLDSVARLTLREDGVVLENVQLKLAEGRLNVQNFVFKEGELRSQGEARDMSLRQMLRLVEDFTQQGALEVNREAQRQADGLRLAAKWDLSGTSLKDLSGRGQISLLEVDAPGALKLNLNSENTADFKFNRGQIDGRLDLVLPSISFAKRYTGVEWDAEGELRFVGRVQGTIEQPEYQGELTGSKLQLLQRAMGWKVSNGTMKARFDAKGFTLEKMRVESGQGYIELAGEARILTGAEARSRAKGLPPLQGRFRLVASKLPIPIGPGQRLILSGDTQVLADTQSLRWVGKLQADEGLIELRSAGVPELPSDVVIVNAKKAKANAKDEGAEASLARAASSQLAALTQDSPLRLSADLEVDLGKNLRVVGGGVDARLEGLLSLKGTLPQQPRAVGIVTVKEGTYLAYGQKLEVTRGILRFQGELDNPSLDLVALRRFLPVEPGVQVTGTALSPRIKLTSTPEVSDAEKLSWLVLGTGIDDARTGTQTLALQQAAFSLLGSEEGGLSSSIAKVFGLDVITLGTARSAAPSEVIGRGLGPLGTNASQAVNNATVQQNVLTIGKRLSSRVFLSYEQGLRGVWNLLRIQYDISNRLSIRAQTGTENAIDLLLFHWFD
jgi:translocation and assembly module TamB